MSGFRNIVISSPCKLQYKGGYMVVRREDDTAKYIFLKCRLSSCNLIRCL